MMQPSAENKKKDNYTKNYSASLSIRHEGPDLEKLEEITLSENPSEKEIREYIRQIALVTAKQNSYSENDPQVVMLSEIGNENLELLLKYNAVEYVSFNY